jgi:hypothetical protein
MLPKLVYIASPYSAPTPEGIEANVRRQMEVAHEVMDLGQVPFVPNLNHYLDQVRKRTYDEWINADFEIIKRCDILLRLEGRSPGADREVALAKGLGLPVVYSLAELSKLLYDQEFGLTRIKVRV